MFRTVHVPHGHRAFVRVDGRAVRFLGPGTHRVLARPFAKVEVELHDTSRVLATLSREQLAITPSNELVRVSLADHERALLAKGGRPLAWLAPHEHFAWTAAGPLDVEVVDTSAIEAPALPETIRAVVPSTDYVEVSVPEGAVALRYVDGVIDSELGPGRHAAWTTTRKVAYAIAARVGAMHVLYGAFAPFPLTPAEGAARA